MYDGTILFNYITRILFLKTSTNIRYLQNAMCHRTYCYMFLTLYTLPTNTIFPSYSSLSSAIHHGTIYSTYTSLTTDSATPKSYLSPTDGLTNNSLTHTYFNQRQVNTSASLPQGGRPAGLGAAQTSIFWGRPPPKNTYGGVSPFPIPHNHRPSPTLGKQWSNCPFPNLGEIMEP